MPEIWIDVGGTFTDCVATAGDGSLVTHKLLSSSSYLLPCVSIGGTTVQVLGDQYAFPDNFFAGFSISCQTNAQEKALKRVGIKSYDAEVMRLELAGSYARLPTEEFIAQLSSCEPSPIVGARYLLGLGANQPIQDITIKLGTTKGTNALLEGKGARTAIVLTKGFGDLLEIGDQTRRFLFRFNQPGPWKLYETVVEAEERIDSQGNIISPLNVVALANLLKATYDSGIESLAIACLNSYRNPAHENEIKKIASSIGFKYISCSNQLHNEQNYLARASTAAVDAYLTPILGDYLKSLKKHLDNCEVYCMTSAGALASTENFHGKDSILSGPAGGVVGAKKVTKNSSEEDSDSEFVISFDMGGTSTDICVVEQQLEPVFDLNLSLSNDSPRLRLASPMLDIHTIAAGGGSVCSFAGGMLQVGPESAGSFPGPACYGNGGPLTITDLNLLLGRIDKDYFSFPLNLEASEYALDALLEIVNASLPGKYEKMELAEALIDTAVCKMAIPIKKICAAKGIDVEKCTLVAFGGAAGQIVCPLARELSVKEIIMPPTASVLSAYGMGVAEFEKYVGLDVQRDLDTYLKTGIEADKNTLKNELHEAYAKEGVKKISVASYRYSLDLRYVGQDQFIAIPYGDDIAIRFEEEHKKLYGFSLDRDIMVHALRLRGTLKGGEPESTEKNFDNLKAAKQKSGSNLTNIYFDDTWHKAERMSFQNITQTSVQQGPCLISGHATVAFLLSGFSMQKGRQGNYHISACSEVLPSRSSLGKSNVNVALWSNKFMAIAEQMGSILERTSMSVNIKERKDFSCAIFTAKAELLANAPHIPVHLGAMGETIRGIADRFPDMKPGDVYVTNNPYIGGSHLPDLTVVLPVFDEHAATLLGFLATRAHHAEIGGLAPGSMSAATQILEEEGVIIDPLLYVEGGVQQREKLKNILCSGRYPSRAVEENLIDIDSQIAACQKGKFWLHALIDQEGKDAFLSAQIAVFESSSRHMQQEIRQIKPGIYTSADKLDSGEVIAVKIRVRHVPSPSLEFDFSGSSGMSGRNYNAPAAIAKAAVMYCLRCLMQDESPLNEGILSSIKITLPRGSIVNPTIAEPTGNSPAVAAGNVETSQRIVDVVLAALGKCANSQGTMNNVIFGSEATNEGSAFSYYETIGGGMGASADCPGASGLQSHMTNTKITDAEVLEDRYPLRLIEFSLRKGSGGRGRWNGGEGLVREFEFLRPTQVSLITSRRLLKPSGINSGFSAMPGENLFWKAKENKWTSLPSCIAFEADALDRVRVVTPGGGGFGMPVVE